MTTKYEQHREYIHERLTAQSAKGRDIGQIPDIVDPDRREQCRASLRLFCETYNPAPFYLGWSDFQLEGIERIQEAVILGAMYALAWPRGSGKTTIVRTAAVWAVAYRHRRYPFVIGANAPKAEATLDAIKLFIRFSPEFAQDFPEIAYPVAKLGGIPNRANGQLCQGEPTLMTWSGEEIKLPTVPPPANWPKHWPLRADGKVPTSESFISSSGLTGEGIRGSVKAASNGEQVRPDFVMLDDPQTDESASSLSQNQAREDLVSGAVLGMAGPDKSISAVMPCTVIKPDDFIDRILDRSKHPLWRGERVSMLATMPTNLAAWDAYFDLRSECAQRKPPDFTEANDYYEAHREELDAGALATWPARKLPGEVSPIQSAINLYHRNRRKFFSEYQNTPLPDIEGEPEVVTPELICSKLHRSPRRQTPLGASRLTAMIDIQHACLYFVVVAWEDNFTGYVIDYGAWPDQKRNYFTLLDVKVTLMDVLKAPGLEAACYGGLERLCDEMLGREYLRDDGAQLKIERCFIDANYGPLTDTVYKFARQSKHASIVMPCHGRFVGPAGIPFSDVKRKPGERHGLNWRAPNVDGKRAVRHVLYDANWWKSFVYSRFATPMGGRGCLSLFGERGDLHRMFADQCVAEVRDRQSSKIGGREVDVWTMKPHKPDNHFFDCLVGCAVAGEMQGVRLPETQAIGGARVGPRASLKDMQAAAQKRREAR